MSEVFQRHADQFGHAKPRSIDEMKHGPVPQPGRRSGIRSVQQSLDFLVIQIVDDRVIMGLHRYGMNLPGQVETGMADGIQDNGERI